MNELRPLISFTKDGSHTLLHPYLDENYHSTHGALTEALHVFIQEGLEFRLELDNKNPIVIFEMGFGSGLNTWLTSLWALKLKRKIIYYSIDNYILSKKFFQKLNFSKSFYDLNKKRNFMKDSKHLLSTLHQKFLEIHQSTWNQAHNISEFFSLIKLNYDIHEFFNYLSQNPVNFDLLFYDAFSPRRQPTLWETTIFLALKQHCSSSAVLVSYCAQSRFKKTLKSLDFKVSAVQGPPGKREMTRALV